MVRGTLIFGKRVRYVRNWNYRGRGKREIVCCASLAGKLGATLLIADELGHVVMEPGRSAYCQIVEHFGQNIVSLDGSIDRAALAEIVFSDARARGLA